MMFKRLLGLAVVLTLLSAAPSVKIHAAAPAPAQEKKGAREPHPHIRAALRELEEAKHELQTAAHDFGGHRKEAVEAVNTAIRQLHEALEYDKN